VASENAEWLGTFKTKTLTTVAGEQKKSNCQALLYESFRNVWTHNSTCHEIEVKSTPSNQKQNSRPALILTDNHQNNSTSNFAGSDSRPVAPSFVALQKKQSLF